MVSRVSVLLALLIVPGCKFGQLPPADGPPDPTPTTVQCIVPEGAFTNGFHGTCTHVGQAEYELVFKDDEGTELLRYDWPGDIKGPQMDCPALCNATVFYWGTANPLLLGPPFFPFGTPREVNTCNRDTFDCIGACGPGCLGCSEDEVGTCGDDDECVLVEYRGYTKDCCHNHDYCTLISTTLLQHIACAGMAQSEGCSLKDLWAGGSGDVYKERACVPD